MSNIERRMSNVRLSLRPEMAGLEGAGCPAKGGLPSLAVLPPVGERSRVSSLAVAAACVCGASGYGDGRPFSPFSGFARLTFPAGMLQ